MYSPKIAEELIPKLYKLGKEKKKPMTHIVNEILKEAIAHFDIAFILSEHEISGETLVVKSRIHPSPKWFHCPLCHNDFTRVNGQKIPVSSRSGKLLKVLVCPECCKNETVSRNK
jgi:hypothetical protein